MVNHAWTLDDYLFHLFESGQTESSEFKVLLRIYGKERVDRVEKAWREHKEKQTSLSTGPPKKKFSRFHPEEKDDDDW